MLDFHNHLMPAVDDGAQNLDESREGLATLRDQGVREIITTPHFQASVVSRPKEAAAHLEALDAAWAQLKSLAESEFQDLRVERGVEVALDIPKPRIEDERLRLAGSSFVLVEFPHMNIPPNSTLAIRQLVQTGVRPVIAHPERYSGMTGNDDLIDSWRSAGAFIQVNSGSLLGYYGANPKRLAWWILSRGSADYLSSDYHSRGKCSVAECATLMKSRGGEAQHRALTITNPRRIILDQMPLPVAAFNPAETPLWKRLAPWR